MISFNLSEDESVAQSFFRTLATGLVRPSAADHDNAGAVSADLLLKLHETGFAQAMLEDGDQPSRLRNCLLLEELGWADTSIAVLVGATLGYIRAVLSFGSPEQLRTLHKNYQQPHFRAGAILAQEPGFGADLNALRTSATATADGYRLSGAKAFVPGLSGCEDMIVIARLDQGHAAFLVDRSTPGVTTTAKVGSLGLRALATGEVRFDGTVLPLDARLGEGRDVDVQSLISGARLGICAILTGLSRAVFEHVTPYTKERVVHGTPLAQKQSVAFRLADMAIDIPAMRWSSWRGAVALEKGGSAAREALLAQTYCAKRAYEIADEGVQLMGGHGYMKENPVERWYRDARTLSLLEGVVGI